MLGCSIAADQCSARLRSAIPPSHDLKSIRIQTRCLPSREPSATLIITRNNFPYLIPSPSVMTGRGGGGGGRGKVLLPPINFIFKLLQQRSTVSIWLFEQLAIRIEGKIRVYSSALGSGVSTAKSGIGF